MEGAGLSQNLVYTKVHGVTSQETANIYRVLVITSNLKTSLHSEAVKWIMQCTWAPPGFYIRGMNKPENVLEAVTD
jgi:hypothetical protein